MGRHRPRLRNEAGAAVFEELLVIRADGTVESRAVFFQLPGEEACPSDSAQPCSDAPLIATAELRLDNGILGFEERRDGTAPLFGGDAELSRRLRGTAITGAASWSLAAQSHDGDLALISPDGRTSRQFVRISPNLLRRLRAGIIVASISAASRAPEAKASRDSFRDCMMIEAFDDVRVPRSDAERTELDARLAALASGGGADLPFSAAELASFAAILSPGEETRRLFCLN